MKTKYRIITKLINEKIVFFPQVGRKCWWWWDWNYLSWDAGDQTVSAGYYVQYHDTIAGALEIIDRHKRETNYLPSVIEV